MFPILLKVGVGLSLTCILGTTKPTRSAYIGVTRTDVLRPDHIGPGQFLVGSRVWRTAPGCLHLRVFLSSSSVPGVFICSPTRNRGYT